MQSNWFWWPNPNRIMNWRNLTVPETSIKTLAERLSVIQQCLVAPKNQFNSFGKYSYRNCEDILQAIKQHLDGLTLTISDEVISIDGRFYIKATATLADGSDQISASAFAREADSKKGMDPAQLTGATSSYARKYALNGLLCIDDVKDADSINLREKKASGIRPDVGPDVGSNTEYPTINQDNFALLQKTAAAILEGLGNDDPGQVKESWDELTRDEKVLIWPAKSKGGWFSQKEKDAIRAANRSITPDIEKPKQ
jgi:hypothetical protein